MKTLTKRLTILVSTLVSFSLHRNFHDSKQHLGIFQDQVRLVNNITTDERAKGSIFYSLVETTPKWALL